MTPKSSPAPVKPQREIKVYGSASKSKQQNSPHHKASAESPNISTKVLESSKSINASERNPATDQVAASGVSDGKPVVVPRKLHQSPAGENSRDPFDLSKTIASAGSKAVGSPKVAEKSLVKPSTELNTQAGTLEPERDNNSLSAKQDEFNRRFSSVAIASKNDKESSSSPKPTGHHRKSSDVTMESGDRERTSSPMLTDQSESQQKSPAGDRLSEQPAVGNEGLNLALAMAVGSSLDASADGR